jgi:hypothetical protein
MKTHIIFFILFIFFLGNCEKKSNHSPIDIPLPGDGSIQGQVTLKGVFGEEKKDFSGVSVSLNNSYFTTTDKSGLFEFRNIDSGNYNLIIEKPGYAPFKCCDFNFVENDTIIPYDRPSFILAEYPEIEMEISIDSFGYAIVTGKCFNTFNFDSNSSLDIILLGDTVNTVNKENYDYITSSAGTGLIELDSNGCFKFEFEFNNHFNEKSYYRVYIASYSSIANFYGTDCEPYICSKQGSEIIELD